jgi:hypothetical protein
MKYCRDNNDGTTSCEGRLRWEAKYTLPTMLPTNKQLAIRVTGPNGQPDQTWATVVSWNVVLSTGAKACTSADQSNCLSGTNYQLNINALSKSDYQSIPVTAGLSGGITVGRGAAAGEVHDCDDVRVENVVVGVSPTPDRISYFNGNPITTVPDSSRLGTDRLGLYTGLNLPPGPVKVVTGGTLDGTTLVPMGSFEAYIYPDTVSILNINGGRPK